jgi:superfamily II DNA or RNA helicase
VTRDILELRDYQREGVEAAFSAWAGGMRRPAWVWATGLGKTVGFAAVGKRWLAHNPGKRVLAIAHTTELVDQMMRKFRDAAPGLRVGRVQANVNETLAPIICASQMTLASENRRRMIRNVGLVIIDEAHHAVNPTYMAILNHYGCLGPEREDSAVALGVTATMMRGDGLALGDVWQDVVHAVTIAEGIALGHLVRPRGLHVQVDDLDLSKVKTAGGDYQRGALGQAIEDSLAPEAIAKAVAEHASERKILLFAPTIASAEVISDALSASGRPSTVVHSKLHPSARSRVLDDYRADSRGVLCNPTLMTEGVDIPSIDCIAIARPTRSAGLYIQMAGRGLRPSVATGKTDCLLLDVVGATTQHSLISGVTLFGEKPEPRVAKDLLDDSDIGLEDPEELASGQQDARQALGLADGPLVTTEVDLFAGSSMAWLRTRAGVFFIEAGERYIMIVPGAPKRADQWLTHFRGERAFCGYDVVAVPKRGPIERREVVTGVEDLAYAMAWAEGAVTPAEKTTATRERSWRARPPSDKLRALAERLHVFIPPGARMGEVSNMVSLVLASRRIDPLLGSWTRG